MPVNNQNTRTFEDQTFMRPANDTNAGSAQAYIDVSGQNVLFDNSVLTRFRGFRPSRRQITLASGFAAGAILALLAMTNGSSLYQAESRLYVDVRQAQAINSGNAKAKLDPDAEARVLNDMQVQLTSPPVLGKVIETLGLQKTRLFVTDAEPDVLTSLAGWYRSFFMSEPVAMSEADQVDTMGQLEQAIQLGQDSSSSVISIKVTTSRPRTSAQIANQLVEVLKENENKQAPVATVSQAQLDAMLVKVQKADQAIAEFQTQTAVPEISNEASEIATELADLRGKLQATQKTLDLLKKGGNSPSLLNALADDVLTPKLVALKDQLRVAQDKVAELSQSLGPKHPDLLAAQKAVDRFSSDIAKELPLLAKALDFDLAKKKAAETLLSQELDSRNGAAQPIAPVIGPSLEDLQKQAETLHSQYATMLLHGPNKTAPDPVIRMVSKAVSPDGPIQPGMKTTLFAMIVGGLLGLLATTLALLGKTESAFQWEPVPQERAPLRNQMPPVQILDEDMDAYLTELAVTEAELEAREKELELQEILALNTRLERLARLLDAAAVVEPEPARVYPQPNPDLYSRVFSKAANLGGEVPHYWNSEMDNQPELDYVRDELRALRGKINRYAGKRA